MTSLSPAPYDGRRSAGFGCVERPVRAVPAVLRPADQMAVELIRDDGPVSAHQHHRKVDTISGDPHADDAVLGLDRHVLSEGPAAIGRTRTDHHRRSVSGCTGCCDTTGPCPREQVIGDIPAAVAVEAGEAR